MSAPDHRDLALEAFAADEATLLEYLVTLTTDRNAQRELAQMAIHQIHDLTQRLEKLRQQHWHLIEEYRRHREAVMRRETGRAA